MTFEVVFSPNAQADLDHLFDYLVERAETIDEALRASEAVRFVRKVAESQLSRMPYSYRKVGHRSTRRELILPHGATGHVIRFDIETPTLVVVTGARHQREEDFH